MRNCCVPVLLVVVGISACSGSDKEIKAMCDHELGALGKDSMYKSVQECIEQMSRMKKDTPEKVACIRTCQAKLSAPPKGTKMADKMARLMATSKWSDCKSDCMRGKAPKASSKAGGGTGRVEIIQRCYLGCKKKHASGGSMEIRACSIACQKKNGL